MRHLELPPLLLEAIIENPDALAVLHRVQRAVLSDMAVKKMINNPDTSPQQFVAMIDTLRKAEETGKSKEAVGGNGFLFQIILPNSGESIGVDTRPPIEHKGNPHA